MSPREAVVAVVPVREGSSRIPNKNFVPFGEHPTLVHRKIEHLQQAGCFDQIYLSSDSERVKEIAASCGATFVYRDPGMCSSRPRWDEVVSHILGTVPGDPHVLWAMVTSPLFVRYREAVECYLTHRDSHDSLCTVKPIREYLVDEAGRPFFYGFGVWHPYSDELKTLYALNDAVFIARKSDQLLWRYWIGRKPYLLPCGPLESIDVNFPEDLELARAAEALQGRTEVPRA